jgi:hypothetical protein
MLPRASEPWVIGSLLAGPEVTRSGGQETLPCALVVALTLA